MYSVYTFAKVVGYYELGVLSMSVVVSKKIGWCELYPIFLDFCNCFNFAKPLSQDCLAEATPTS